jgi:DNA-directed RNA polymerase sigma subunit (sigma70/sigma32)
MKQVFEQYDICKRTPGNLDREEYVRVISEAVNLLADKEKEVIIQRYMIDYYRNDYEVYNLHLNRPVSKDTYTKIRNRALSKLYISFSEMGILLTD